MKKIASTLLFLSLSLYGWAEHHYLLSGELANGEDHHYTANSHIMLSSGFKSEPSGGHEVLLCIDPYGVFPPEEGLYGGPLANQDGVVGAIEGVVDIGLLGGACYTLPIELPEGLGKMKPQLAINYNSQGHNGLLGWGWELIGISSITRVGGNAYYDGYSNAVNYLDDRFSLNGQRLMKVSQGAYGGHGVTYRTEEDQMNKIISYHEAGISGTATFQVYGADGTICYYGTSDDSKAMKTNQNQINVWLLKQIKDRYGNEITYHYLNSDEDFLLDKIQYSGNSSQQLPAVFSVEFHYIDRSDTDLYFYGICSKQRRQLLDKIIIKNGANTLYQYQFSYQAPSPQNGYPYSLLKEIGFSAGDQHYNPTRIQWGENNYPIAHSTDVKYNVTTTGIENAFINAIKFSGDFNGDGYSDVIAVKPDSDGVLTSAALFLNKGTDNTATFQHYHTFALDPRISWIHIGDFNGDGRDDIAFVNRQRNSAPLPDVIDAEVYLCRINSQGTLGFRRHALPDCTIPRNTADALLVGDFLGEGKQSILIQSVDDDAGPVTVSLYYTYDNSDEGFHLRRFPSNIRATQLFPADYNGDGITEILYKDDDGDSHIIQLHNGNILSIHEISTCHPTDWEDCFPGDFNGDGKADLLCYTSGEPRPWRVFLSHSKGISNKSFLLPYTFPYSSPGDYHFSLDNLHSTSHYLKIGDFDGNGCSDIALFYDNRFYVFYGPLSINNGTEQFAYSHQISTQLFNLYDNLGVCIGNFLGKENQSFLGHTTLSHLPPLPQRYEVRSITDGMGRRTDFSYDYLVPNPCQPTEDDFYVLHSSLDDPDLQVYSTPLPLRALKSVTTYNMKNKPVTTQCSYEGGLIHKRGKGFLGFSKTKQDDYCNQQRLKRTIRSYELASLPNILYTALSEELVYNEEGKRMAHSSYSNLYYLNKKNEKVFVHLADKTLEEYDDNHPDQLQKKIITGTTVNTDSDNPHYYNELIHITETNQGTTTNPTITIASLCEYQTSTLIEYMGDLTEEWLIDRPLTRTLITHHEGDEDLIRQSSFNYSNGKPFQLRSVLEMPYQGTQSDLKLARMTSYEYDAFGNPIAETASTPYDRVPPRTNLFEYGEAYQHLRLTKHTNAAGQETIYHYDPVYLTCTTILDCNGLATQFEQDPLGATLTTHHPDGTKTCKAVRWSGSNYSVWEKKSGQPSKLTFFFKTGDPYRSHCYDISGNTVVTQIEYDDLGRVVKTSAPHLPAQTAASVQYHYANPYRIGQIVHADGTREDIKCDGNETITLRQDLDGNPQEESKITNVMGWTIKSTDANGTSVIYDYYPDGKPKWSQIEGHDETRIEMCYDGWRNRVSLFDPNYGRTSSEYNAFGERICHVTPNRDTTLYEYDLVGNLVRRTETDSQGGAPLITEWFYSQEDGRKGLLTLVQSEKQTLFYEYDPFLRLTNSHEYRAGKEYLTQYTYDKASRVQSITHPSQFTVHYRYTSEGNLRTVLDDAMRTIWITNETSPTLQPLRCTTGDGLCTSYSYDPNNQQVMSIQTVRDQKVLQSYRYEYDGFSNMTSRSDLTHFSTERFSYDPLNRLTSCRSDEGTSDFTYDALGRMTSKTNADNTVFSNADYSGSQPYAIKTATTLDGVFPQERMDLRYTPFDKVSSITEGTHALSFEYGFDKQRILVTDHRDGKVWQKHYVNQCEFLVQPNHDTITRTFLNGPYGIFAVAETVHDKTTLHYIHKDHLGSWTLITNQNGEVEQEIQFDAWGNTLKGERPFFDRGFTGHEHIAGTALINMNGRLYDPVTSSMLSPDNNIQIPDFSQNFNRYSYCINNPLAFTDPDGNTFIEEAILFYVIYCTDFGYELQKYISPIAIHIDLHLSKQQMGVGADVSMGVPKACQVSYRTHFGATYYWALYDHCYQGWEFRAGGEWCLFGFLGFSGTKYFSGEYTQSTNSLIIGNYLANFTYENDFMFNIGNYLPGIPFADNGDRYRSAAARFMVGPLSIGLNLFTGDPGINHDDRRTYNDPEANNRETYTINESGDDPDRYRAGILYVGLGPVKLGVNSENIRHFFQNRFAHDFLCRGDSPYFKVLNRPTQGYFYFGTGTGSNLW